MSVVVTFENYLPPSRYDSLPWTQARIEEAAAAAGTYTLIDTIALTPVDADPENPASRSFTTENGTATDYWYRVVFADADGDTSIPTSPVQHSSEGALYVTVDELKTALSLTNETYADADLAASAAAASRAVDGTCDTRFYPAADERKYTPVSEEYLLIDDAAEVTAVTANGTALTLDTDYAQTGTPVVTVLRALNGYRFPRGRVLSVTVTGTFGWAAPPADVRRATLILAARIFKRSREAPLGVVGFDLDGLSVRMPTRDPDVTGLLRPYTRSGMVE